jgi:hypothetical protein
VERLLSGSKKVDSRTPTIFRRAGKRMRRAIEENVSATRTPSCKDSRSTAMLRHDQALKEGLDEVAKAGFRAGT